MIKKIKRFFAERKLKNINAEIQDARANLEFWRGKLAALDDAKFKIEDRIFKFRREF